VARADDYHSFERQIDSWRIRKKNQTDDRKSYDEVFDKQNLMRIYKLFSDGVMDRFDFPISTGKEGNVFRASTNAGTMLAVKIYRTSTGTFSDMWKYIAGDPRFRGLPTNRRRLIPAWAKKEFLNLGLLYRAGVRVPQPIVQHENIVVMEYIGDEVEPARQLRYVELEDPEGTARTIFEYMKLGYQKAKLVHCDMSEFNVLMLDQEPVIIDVGQGVLVQHPNAEEWLQRDVFNMAKYFKKYGISVDAKELLKEIKGK
jgi:RIO kinase 1